MLGVFSRLFKLAQSEAHSVVDALEDPIKLTEQGIRDLKKDLTASLENLAQIKSLTIRLRSDQEGAKRTASDYERKARLLLEKAQRGALEAGDADRLATEALSQKHQAAERAIELGKDIHKQETLTSQLESKVGKLKSQIATWENELTTLKARAKVAGATKKLNKHLSNADSSSTIAMLEKMKDKVQEEEALATAYGELADSETTLDGEIDKALADGADLQAQDSLAELKKKMGIGAAK